MSRVLSILAVVVLCGIPALAQMSATPVVPVRGAVTIVTPCGQFYTTLGTTESISAGAILQVMRGGCQLATAKVIKVDDLDSIAELQAPNTNLVVQPGDVVLVQSNPVCRPGHCKRDFSPSCLQELLCPGCEPHLPAMEPNMSQKGGEAFLGLTFLASVVGIFINK